MVRDLDLIELMRGLRNHRTGIFNWLRTARHMDVLKVTYANLIDAPDAEIEKLKEFLPDGYIKDPDKLVSAIDSSLYRNRSEKGSG